MKYILQFPGQLKIGGAEKVSRDIGLFADPAEFEVHYVVFGKQIGEYEQELLDHGCKIFHWPEPSENYPKYLLALRNLMKQHPYSAVHVHTMFNAGWVMPTAKAAGIPIRITHAHSVLSNGIAIKKRAYESVMRRNILTSSTDLIACGNDAGERLFGEKAFQERGQLILNGIDTARYSYHEDSRARIREKYDLNDSFVIGHVGHLAEVKNQSFLIRLVPQILKWKQNAKLLMLGEGEDRPMLERLIRELGLTAHVIMTGNVRNVPDYLSAMDVFAFPSLFEGMPLSIIEVQANGLPCILSTGVPEDVHLTDLIHPLSLDRLEQWVHAICSAERRAPERYAGLLREKGFDTHEVMRKFYQIYERADSV